MGEALRPDQIAAINFSTNLGRYIAQYRATELTNLVANKSPTRKIVEELGLEELYPAATMATLVTSVYFACYGRDGPDDSSSSSSYPGVVPEDMLRERNRASKLANVQRLLASGSTVWNENRHQELIDRLRENGQPPFLLDELTVVCQLLNDPNFRRQSNPKKGHPDITMIRQELNHVCHGDKPVRTYGAVKNIISLIKDDIPNDPDVPDGFGIPENF